MNIYTKFKSIIFDIFLDVSKPKNDNINSLSEKFTVELPRDASHGDMSTNICLVLSRFVSLKPIDLAILMKPWIELLDEVNSVSIDGPGFINFNLINSFWHDQIKLILDQKEKYGEIKVFIGKNINVEFVSANPTGPLHVGHVRGAVIGDVLSNILKKVGYNVIKEYYVNDAGNQIDILAHSVFLRYKELIDNKKIQIPEGYYPGEYLIPIAKKLHEKYEVSLLNRNENSLKII